MYPLHRTSPLLILSLSLCFLPSLLPAQEVDTSPSTRERRHDDPQWVSVKEHLPDLATAPPALLETQADLLRVRRFPEDALEFYNTAIRRGGNSAGLMNKVGLTQLELRNIVIAQGYFRQAIKLDRNNAQGWNNLAATEYLEHQYAAAVADYKKAVRLSQATAVFHANLSTAYFEMKNYKRARKEADEALRLDPLVFTQNNGSGVAAHVLTMEDRARFAYEMAKLFAQRGQETDMLHSLSIASENGFDIVANRAKDPALSRFRNDPRVLLIVMTAKALRLGDPAVVANTAAMNRKILDATMQPQ
jgi:tetratricopeptide (TPR) repeat protein